MRRHGTDIMAIGAILAGAAIGAGGTLAFVGDSPDNRSVTAWDCESILVSAGSLQSVRIYTAGRNGELRKKKCPRTIASTVFVERPVRTVDMALQARLQATAQALAEARTRQEVVRALENRVRETDRAFRGDRAAESAEAAGNR
ncbi:MAG: hypothetical protein OXL34_18210 [Gemmatimonadota bacterium]|nr:hypothetical protein [Gemmatimonadota bacterium]